MATITIVFREKRGGDSGSPVLIRIKHKGKSRYFTLPVKVKPKDWNDKTKSVRKTDRDARKKNEYLSNALASAESALGEYLRSHRIHNTERMKSAIMGAVLGTHDESEVTFIAFAREVVAGHSAAGRHERAETLRIIFDKLERFAASKKMGDIAFADVTPKFVRRFERYLAEVCRNAPNTIAKNLKGLRAVVRVAIAEGHMKQSDYPFFSYPISTVEPAQKVKLSREEFEALAGLELEHDSPNWHARNVFCFSVYVAGPRIGDVLAFAWDMIKDDRVEWRQSKTGGDQSIMLPAPAIEILELYRPITGELKYVFPYLNFQEIRDSKNFVDAKDRARSAINNRLKRVSKIARIDKNITTHVARHTFADMARRAGMPIYAISKALGHKSIKQTETYLNQFDNDAVDDLLKRMF